MFRKIVLLLAIYMITGCQISTSPWSLPQPQSALPPSSEISGRTGASAGQQLLDSNQQALENELLMRALRSEQGLRMAASSLTVLPGKLPADLAIKLPLLEKTRIIGSTQVEIGARPAIQIFLDVSESMERVMDVYTASLEQQGLKEINPPFISLPMPSPQFRSSSFCQKDMDVSVSAEKADETLTYVRLSLGSFMTSPCITPEFSYLAPLPNTLTDVPGAVFLGGGSGTYGEGSIFLTRNLETGVSIQGLRSYYDAQLADSGWQQTESGTTANIAWSVWSFKDERNKPWIGTVFVYGNLISPTRKTVIIRADRQIEKEEAVR